MWKGNGNTTTLQFSLKGLEVLYRERRQVNTIVMEHFSSILFHKSGPANKQHTYQSKYYRKYVSGIEPGKLQASSEKRRPPNQRNGLLLTNVAYICKGILELLTWNCLVHTSYSS